MASRDTGVDCTNVRGVTCFPRFGRVVRSVRVLLNFGAGVDYGVHSNSLKNLARGVVERVLYTRNAAGELTKRLLPRPNVFERLNSVKRRLLRNLSPTTVVDRMQYSDLYSGRKKAIYEKAAQSLAQRPVEKRDAVLRTFVKAEKVNFDAKTDPAPRVIQPRSPRYILEVGRYLKNFEKRLYRAFEIVWGYVVIVKGLNAQHTASCLWKNWSQFKKPMAVGLDASRFDQHVSPEALRYEHSIYNSVFRSHELRTLLSWQLTNVGVGFAADGKIKYKVDGCRMSGDINTSMGNCVIMASITLAYFEHVGLNARLSNNGDDCVVFCESGDAHKLAGIGQWFQDFGFKLTQEKPVFNFEEIEFCQTQPVYTSTGWRMVRNIWTAPSKDCVSLLPWDNAKSFSHWRHAIGTCGLELTKGVPVWEAYYRTLLDGSGITGATEKIYDSGMGYMARGVEGGAITDQARYSFWKAFGITPAEQVALEHSFPIVQYSGAPVMFADVDKSYHQNPLTWLARNRRYSD